MKSPFPGMDPYLEPRWSDVHPSLITAIREALQPHLPAGLRARSEERVLIEDPAEDRLTAYRADVAVVTSEPRPTTGSAAVSSSAAVDPVVLTFHEEPVLDRWVQIVDTRDGNRVITAIEVLSPGNKAAGRLNTLYRRKLADYRAGGVSVVEIDLLRDPPRHRLAVRTEDLPIDRRAPYLACVRRAWTPEQWLAYPLPLRSRLPAIPIPLRRADAPVELDLQPLIERVYIGGGHDDIDYHRAADPPLSPDDAAWLRQLIDQPGKA